MKQRKHKAGDTREDGFRYWGLQHKKRKSGWKTYEVWLSPETYQKQIEYNRVRSRRIAQEAKSYRLRKKPLLARLAKAWTTIVG
jgi:hypothetical protein